MGSLRTITTAQTSCVRDLGPIFVSIFNFVTALFRQASPAGRLRDSSRETAEEPAPVAPAASRDQAFEAGFENLVTAALAAGKPLLAGTIELVGLKSIQQEVGPEWAGFPDAVRQMAEEEIARSLGPRDLFRVYDNDNFALCFVNLDKAQAQAKSRQIVEAIKARIQLARPERAQQVSVEPFIAEVPASQFDDLSEPLGETLIGIMARLNAEAREASRTVRRRLIRDFNIVFAPMWSAHNGPASLNRCVLDLSLGSATLARFRAIADREQMLSTLAELDHLVVTRAVEALHYSHRSAESFLLVAPISYKTVELDRESGALIELLSAVPAIYRNFLILEVTAIPADADLDSVLKTCAILAPFASRLVIEVNARADLLGAELAELAWGVSWTLHGLDHTGLGPQSVLVGLIDKARELGLQTLGHGANTIGLAEGAVDAGFEHLDGPAVHLNSAVPCAAGRLHPVRYKEPLRRRS